MNCADCKFWGEARDVSLHFRRGQCRRRAPVPSSYIVLARAEHGATGALEKCETDVNEESREALWPQTWDTDWCGEWSAVRNNT